MNSSSIQALSLKKYLRPEDALEEELLGLPKFQQGLLWGKPRFGHPEGKVIYHVAEVFENIDKLNLDDCSRNKLRKVALVHDTFKIQEEQFAHPRKWDQNHAVFARNFFTNYTEDQVTLDLIEFHDEAYYSWRNLFLYDQEDKGQARIEKLKSRFAGQMQLYYLFFKCDTRTGDKNQAPIKWFEETFVEIEKVEF